MADESNKASEAFEKRNWIQFIGMRIDEEHEDGKSFLRVN
jgi:hypothetical protein